PPPPLPPPPATTTRITLTIPPHLLAHYVPPESGIIRCVCSVTADDGFTIQCDRCNVWQHALCVEISPDDVPDEYLCELCDPDGARSRGVDPRRAEEGQRRRIEAELMRNEIGGDRSSSPVSSSGSEMRRVGRGLGGKESDGEDWGDDDYEPWQYEFTPIERDLYQDKALLARLAELLASEALVGNSSDLPADPESLTLDSLPSTVGLSVRALAPTSFHLVPPVASTYAQTSSQAPTCPYQRPTTHALFAAQAIPAGGFISPFRGQITSLETYRRDPVNQYSLLGVPKPGVRAVPVPWSLAVDGRRFGNETRFARSGCHPNAVIRVVRIKNEKQNDCKGRATRASTPWSDQRTRGGVGEQLTFAIFATADIGKKEEIVLPWDWDDGHVAHLLPALMASP
ncbi:hypothetical protein T439DRAFT_278757, partial [Meredithblackwellia eburnea MCA 4105]